MDRIDRVVGVVSRVMAILGALAAGVIMVTMTLDVIERTTQGRSLPGAYEFVETMIVVSVFLALPYGERTRSHVRVELVTNALRGRVRDGFRLLGHVAATVVAGWMSWATLDSFRASFATREYTTGLVDFPIYPAKLCVFIGLTWLTVELALTCASIIRPLLSSPGPAAIDPDATDGHVSPTPASVGSPTGDPMPAATRTERP